MTPPSSAEETAPAGVPGSSQAESAAAQSALAKKGIAAERSRMSQRVRMEVLKGAGAVQPAGRGRYL